MVEGAFEPRIEGPQRGQPLIMVEISQQQNVGRSGINDTLRGAHLRVLAIKYIAQQQPRPVATEGGGEGGDAKDVLRQRRQGHQAKEQGCSQTTEGWASSDSCI